MVAPAIPIVAGLGFLGATALVLRRRAVVKNRNATTSPPNFKTSPPAAAAIPARVTPEQVKEAQLPVITQSQFKELSQRDQELIRKDALLGMLTFTSTTGTLFADGTDTRPGMRSEDFIGAFKPGMVVKGNMLTVDASRAPQAGLNLQPVTTGSVILEALSDDNGSAIPSITRDPRIQPDRRMLVPLGLITGAGDP